MIRFTFQRDGQTERRKSYFRIWRREYQIRVLCHWKPNWVCSKKKRWSVKSILMVTFMICPHCCVLHVKLEQLRKVLPCNQLENRPPRSVNDVLEPSTSCSNCLNHKVTLSSNQNVSHFLEKKFRSIPTELVTNYIQLFLSLLFWIVCLIHGLVFVQMSLNGIPSKKANWKCNGINPRHGIKLSNDAFRQVEIYVTFKAFFVQKHSVLTRWFWSKKSNFEACWFFGPKIELQNSV